MDRPLFIGVSILELSKLQMFSYYYDFLKPIYGSNISLLYSDTDSLIIKILGDDNLKVIEHSLRNNSEIFFFKNEIEENTNIAAFVALKTKVYSTLVVDLQKNIHLNQLGKE